MSAYDDRGSKTLETIRLGGEKIEVGTGDTDKNFPFNIASSETYGVSSDSVKVKFPFELKDTAGANTIVKATINGETVKEKTYTADQFEQGFVFDAKLGDRVTILLTYEGAADANVTFLQHRVLIVLKEDVNCQC